MKRTVFLRLCARSIFGDLQLVPRCLERSYLIGPIPICERASHDVKSKGVIHFVDRVGAEVRDIGFADLDRIMVTPVDFFDLDEPRWGLEPLGGALEGIRIGKP
jgi:hypothetical protein